MVKYVVRQPLTSTFMLVSMLGFFVSVLLVWQFSKSWGFAFGFLFAIFFIAAVYNFAHAPDEDVLAVHEPHRHLKHTAAYQKK